MGRRFWDSWNGALSTECSEAKMLKREVIKRNPGLALIEFSKVARGGSGGAGGRELIRGVVNPLRVQVIDLNMLCEAMKIHRTRLTHDHMTRFFTWLENMVTYFEWHSNLEDDVMYATFEDLQVPIRGELSPARRMLLRGRLQKSLHDLYDTNSLFRPNQPAGETFALLPPLVKKFTALTIEYTTKFTSTLAPLLDKHFNRCQIDRFQTLIFRYIVNQRDAKNLIVMYTYWMNTQQYKRWKRKYCLVLFRIYKYKFWEMHLYNQHLKTADRFAGELYFDAIKQQHQQSDEQIWKSNYSRITAKQKLLPAPSSITAAVQQEQVAHE